MSPWVRTIFGKIEGEVKVSVAVVGASGAVGREVVGLLERYDQVDLRVFGSERSAGTTLPWRGGDIAIELLTESDLSANNLVFMTATSELSSLFARKTASFGNYVIDNSSCFRMDPNVPLVIPEINFESIKTGDRLIANPNCCTIILLMAVAPLRKLGGIKRIIVSTYQSASGAGREAMDELEQSTKAALEGKEFEPTVLPHPYAFNLFSHNTPIDDSGYNGEETKIIAETRKILSDSEIGVNPTCIRVPILRAHSESITVEFEDFAPDEEAVRRVLRDFPGVRVVDDRDGNHFPMPVEASGQADVLVGRIRRDPSNPRAVSMFACGDQLLKGAALNAVQIADRLLGFS
jgi:aspartate-semialdehyde dehydrogenase